MIVAYYEKITGRVHTVLQAPGLDSMPQPSSTDFGIILANPISLPGYMEGTTYVPLPPSPSAAFQFNWSTKQWEDPRTLADLKAAKWEQVKAQRDAAEFGLFEWAGHSFDGDEAAQRRITLAVMGAQAALIAGNTVWSVDWTLADNTSLTLSASDMMGVANALGANIAQAHAAARAKRQQIQQAATKEELDAI